MKTNAVTRMFGVAAIGLMLASCDSDSTTSDSTSSGEKFDSAPGKVTGKIFQLNEKITLADSEWTVLTAKNLGNTLKGDEDEGTESKKSEGKFVYVRFKMVNNTKGNEEIIFTPTLQDSQGRNFEQMDSLDAIGYLPKGETTMDCEQLPSGVPKTFAAIFEVPEDASGLMFLARTISDAIEPDLSAIGLNLN